DDDDGDEPAEPDDPTDDEDATPDDTEDEPDEDDEADEPVDEPDEDDEDDDAADAPAETGGFINWSATTGDSGIGNPILSGALAWVDWWCFSRLFKYDDYGDVLHELAEDFDVSDDGLVWTFNLVETTWHDGEPFDAEDVIFTFETIN